MLSAPTTFPLSFPSDGQTAVQDSSQGPKFSGLRHRKLLIEPSLNDLAQASWGKEQDAATITLSCLNPAGCSSAALSINGNA